jgi:hypothetical protein
MASITTTSKQQALIESVDKFRKELPSREEMLKRQAEQEKQFQEAKRKGRIKLVTGASIVPIGLYAFSKYKGYDSKKTAKVTIIGSVIIFGAVVLNGFSGAWSGETFADSLLAKIGIGKKSKSLSPKVPQAEQILVKQAVEIQK